MLAHAVRRGLVPAVIALSAAACAGSEAAGPAASTSTPPVVPTPPVAPALALSTDSVVVSLIAGADRITQEIEITAGTSAAVSGLTVSEPIFASGQTTGWITATIASQTAPAKLSVSINPGALVAGKYEAQLRISASDSVPLTRPAGRSCFRTTSLEAWAGPCLYWGQPISYGRCSITT